MAPQLLTTAEAATYLNMSPRTLETWRTKFIGPPYVKPEKSNSVRYREADLEQWVTESVQGGQP
jgi:DNA-binding transcriptional MerR regulator